MKIATSYPSPGSGCTQNPADLVGGEPPENAHLLKRLLENQDDSPRRDVVLLNAAAALATEDGDFEGALRLAENSLSSGAAQSKLKELVAYSQAMALQSAYVQ